MTEQWKWSAKQAISIVMQTYNEDWYKARKDRNAFLSNPLIHEIDDENIKGLTSGSGKAVIFIHGSPANAMRWSYYLKNAPAEYQFISIDRMGFGNRGQTAPNLEEDSKLLETYINQFDKPIIVGHSLGGAMATRLACTCDIEKSILIASSIDPILERIAPIQKIGANKFASKILSRSIRNSNYEMIQLPKFLQHSEPLLPKITAPVDIIHPKDDALVSYDNVAYAQKHFINAKSLDITSPKTGGHCIPWTQPDLIMRVITNE